MLSGVFRTKEKIFLSAILVLIIVIGIFLFFACSNHEKYVEQAVMAENYLNAGNYEQAIEAYTKALSMKNANAQLLSTGLAGAYVGMNDYDKALEVLRSYYQKKPGNKLKEKIEEVIAKKTEYEYHLVISRADIYFSNKEYDKAITEYEKAKLIKSKEVYSYKKIVEAYIEKEDYEKAREEVIEGQELTKDESLAITLEVVEGYITKEQYNKLMERAAEYIAQENYEEGIKNYEEAIKLLPKESQAYLSLAKTYITQKDYIKAVRLLSSATTLIESDELKDLLNKAVDLKAAEEERKYILNGIYDAMDKKDHTN